MCIACLGLVLALEFMKTINAYLKIKIKVGPMSVNQTVTNEDDDSPLIHALRIPPSTDYIKNYR